MIIDEAAYLVHQGVSGMKKGVRLVPQNKLSSGKKKAAMVLSSVSDVDIKDLNNKTTKMSSGKKAAMVVLAEKGASARLRPTIDN